MEIYTSNKMLRYSLDRYYAYVMLILNIVQTQRPQYKAYLNFKSLDAISLIHTINLQIVVVTL